MADTVSGVLKRPFAEQVAAFRLRLGDLVPTRRWDDIAGAAHDRAFMVAGAMKADLLADLAGAVDRAVSQGGTLEDFRRDFRATVERQGWHGWTGEGTKAGEAWRTRVIYRTNMATTYAAGQRAQLIDGGYGLWIYRHGGSREPRPEHLAWDGLTLPADHPFWETHSPPNGWGCSCYVTGARSERGARRLGGDPDKTLPEGWDRVDRRTGAPGGIDRGWGHAPGATVAEAVRALAPKLDLLPAQPSVALIQDWLRLPAFDAWMAAPQGNWPLARLADADAAAIGARTRIAVLSAETMAKQRREHPELTRADYAAVQTTIATAQHRWTDIDPRSGTQSRLFAYEDSEAGHVVVVKATLTGMGLFVTSLRRLPGDPARRRAIIASLRRSRSRGKE